MEIFPSAAAINTKPIFPLGEISESNRFSHKINYPQAAFRGIAYVPGMCAPP